MDDPSDIQRLLRLKRYETPGERYYEFFQEQFRDRQRAELLHRSSLDIFRERLALWISEMGPLKWAIPTVASTAAIALFFTMAHFAGPVEEPLVSHEDSSSGDAIEFSPLIQIDLPQTGETMPAPPVREEFTGNKVLRASLRGPLYEF